MPYRFYGYRILVVLCCLLIGCLPQAYAAAGKNACGVDHETARRDQGNETVIGIVTGPEKGSTYYRFGVDIANMVKDKYGEQIKIDVRTSAGGLQNTCRIASEENAAFGLVYADTLSFLKRWRNAKIDAIANKLRLVFPLFESEVHVFAHKSIKNIQALDGLDKPVVVGEQGSSTWITVHNLLHLLQIELKQPVEASLEDGIKQVLDGTAVAFLRVGGKPVKAWRDLAEQQKSNPVLAEQLRHVHFVPVDDDRLLRQREYIQATLGPDDYPWLPGPGKIATISTKAVLISFAFSNKATPTNAPRRTYASRRCKAMYQITEAIRETVNNLNTSGNAARWHRKWQQVDLGEYVSIWQYDEACTSRPSKSPTPSEKRMLDVVTNSLGLHR